MSEYGNNQFYLVETQPVELADSDQIWEENFVFLGNRPPVEKIMMMLNPDLEKNDEKISIEQQTRDSEEIESQPRITRIIEICYAKRQEFIKIHKGTKNQTVELNTNYKTIIDNFLKDLITLKQLTEQEFRTVNIFRHKVPSFQALLAAFFSEGSQSLRKRICEYLESTFLVKKILKSRANRANKARMLKFLEVLRINLKGNGKVIKWKAHRNRRFKS